MDFGLSSRLRGALNALASVAFVALAIAAIQYDESVAPKIAGVADTIVDLGRRLTGA